MPNAQELEAESKKLELKARAESRKLVNANLT
jgi:hypothetical protein